MIAITKRCLLLLQMLCRNPDPVPVRNLAEQLGVSERTVRYDLSLLEDWLKERDVRLKRVPQKGVCFDTKNREKAWEILQEQDEYVTENRFLNSGERVGMMIIDVLEGESDYSFDEGPRRFGVSRATFVRDMEKVSEWFDGHNVQLLRKQRRGVRIDADEIVCRRLIIDFIQENSSQPMLMKYFILYKDEESETVSRPSTFTYINRIFGTVNLNQLIAEVDVYLKKWHITISDEKYIWMIYYLVVMITRIKDGHVVTRLPKQYDSLTNNTQKNELKQKIQKDLSQYLTEEEAENEAFYLVAYMYMSAKKGKETDLDSGSETAIKASAYLQEEIRSKLGLDLSGDSELLDALKTHLQAAIIRAQLGIPAHNAMLEEIQIKFPDIYAICKEIAEDIGDRYGVLLSEEEIGFVTMYIVLSIQKNSGRLDESENVRAALICGYGVGTVAFLTSSLKRQFPMIAIVDQLSIFDIQSYDFSQIDLVFTTIDIPLVLPKPVIKVNPILRRMDIRRIDSFLRTKRADPDKTAQEFRINELMYVIGRHCDVKNKEELIEELKRHIEPNGVSLMRLTEFPSFYDILPKKYIQAHIDAADWESAVQKAAKPLIKDGCITEKYVREIIELKNRYQQYAVISNGICMPHAEPDAKYKLACSLATLKEPLELMIDGKPVLIYVVMVLALSDTVTQAKALDEVFILLDEFPEFPMELQKAGNVAEISRILRHYYNRLN